MKAKPTRYLARVGLLALTPLVYGAAFATLGHQKIAYWLGPNPDPDYAYLVSSLAMANFLPPGLTVHPGTPVQLLGAMALWLNYGLRSAASLLTGQPVLSFSEAVLSDPEPYLSGISYALLGLCMLGVLALGLTVFLLTNRLLLALLSQLTPLLLVRTLAVNEPSRVDPETAIFFFSQLLATLLVVYLFRRGVDKTRWFALSLGVIFGLGMATKITFLPAIIFGLAIAGYRLKLLALATSVVTFVAATLPILSEYGRVWRWMSGIALTSGKYGTGDRGLSSPATLGTRLAKLFERDNIFFYLLFAISALCVISGVLRLLGKMKRSGAETSRTSATELDERRNRLILWLTIVMWSQVFVTINEFAHSRYLVLAVGLCGLLLVLMVTWIESLAADIRIPYLAPAACAFVYALCIGTSIQQYNLSYDQVSSRFQNLSRRMQNIENTLDEPQYQGCLVVLERRASTIRSALFYGDRWADSAFSDLLNKLYPNSFFILRGSFKASRPIQFLKYGGPAETSEVIAQSNGCTLLRSRPDISGGHIRKKISSNVILEDLLSEKKETLYRMRLQE